MHIVVQIARFLVQQSLHTLKRRKLKSDLVRLHVQLQDLFVISIYRKKHPQYGRRAPWLQVCHPVTLIRKKTSTAWAPCFKKLRLQVGLSLTRYMEELPHDSPHLIALIPQNYDSNC